MRSARSRAGRFSYSPLHQRAEALPEDWRMLGAILLILLLLILLAALPAWPYSRRWGYYPSGSVGLILVILLVLLLIGRI
jgi:Protein of unknown function (DUF3309)